MKFIETAYDARLSKFYADINRELASERRMLRVKIRRWERKVEEFNGQAHIDVLNRFKTRLQAIS